MERLSLNDFYKYLYLKTQSSDHYSRRIVVKSEHQMQMKLLLVWFKIDIITLIIEIAFFISFRN